jgi:hypothetical protein
MPIANAVIGKRLTGDMCQRVGMSSWWQTCEDAQNDPGEVVDAENWYVTISSRSTLMVERIFNHHRLNW